MSKKQFKCLNCQKLYFSFKDNSKFCSKDCQFNYYNVEYCCDSCGKFFYTKRHKIEKLKNGNRKNIYCSKECAINGSRTSVNKKCNYCGKIFKTFLSSSDNRKYCSVECYDKSRGQKNKLRKIFCKQCGKYFETYNKKQKYCSSKCCGISQQKRDICICDNCGKFFEKKISDISNNNFCCIDCRLEFIRWNEHDINILKNNYRKINNNQLKDMLSKDYSIKAIRSMAKTLGFSKSRTWTKDEERILIDNYSKIPMFELEKKLPNRSHCSIIGKARSLKLLSYHFLNNVYSKKEIDFLTENYLKMSNEELAKNLGRSVCGISLKLINLGLYRDYEIKKDGYKKINKFIRAKLSMWKEEVKKENNYTCCLSGERSNIVVHHCRGFNTLIQETSEILNFDLNKDFIEYADSELELFFMTFFELQEFYGEYVCVTESIHKLFHNSYGYGDNTIEQWNEFVQNYKIGIYNNVN